MAKHHMSTADGEVMILRILRILILRIESTMCTYHVRIRRKYTNSMTLPLVKLTYWARIMSTQSRDHWDVTEVIHCIEATLGRHEYEAGEYGCVNAGPSHKHTGGIMRTL